MVCVVDLIIVIVSGFSLAFFWFIMLAVFAGYLVFYFLEKKFFVPQFSIVRSPLLTVIDGLILLVIIVRNVIVLLNFIPLIQLLGIALLLGSSFDSFGVGSLLGSSYDAAYGIWIVIVYSILLAGRYSLTKLNKQKVISGI